MARSGRWLFRWRSYLPLLFLPILVVSLVDIARIGGSDSLAHLLWEALCGAIAAAGLALRAFTVGHAPAHTGDFFAGRLPHVDFGWALLVATGVVVYGVLRWMKAHNRLAVEGR